MHHVSFDAVDDALKFVPYLTCRYRHWGECWVIRTPEPDGKKGDVVYKTGCPPGETNTVERRNLRPALQYALWFANKVMPDLMRQDGQSEVVIRATLTQAQRKITKEIGDVGAIEG